MSLLGNKYEEREASFQSIDLPMINAKEVIEKHSGLMPIKSIKPAKSQKYGAFILVSGTEFCVPAPSSLQKFLESIISSEGVKAINDDLAKTPQLLKFWSDQTKDGRPFVNFQIEEIKTENAPF